jgi:hypothetical protein
MGLPAVNGPLWPVLEAAIERDPTAAVRALGTELSAQKDRQTQAEPIPIGIEGTTMSSTPIPIGIEKQGQKIQSLSCVGIASKTTLKTAPEPRPRCERGRQIHADHAQAGADGIGKREVIKALEELWQRVGIRAMTLPKIGRAGALLADKTAARRRQRLSVAQAAPLAAITRHAPKLAPVPTDPDDDRHVDRSEAQDLHAWND